MPRRVLITGGAGFVGSHLADGLLQRGHQVRIFDALAEQVHGDGIPFYLSSEVEFQQGDMRDLGSVCRAVKGAEVIFHLASAVGVGQSMYEIAHYMSANTLGTANLLQALLENGNRLEKLVVASSMSIYGEGKYRCAQCGEQAPPPRTAEQMRQHQWEPSCPRCGHELAPIPTDEAKPLQCTSIYALSKKDQEEMTLLYGRTYGLPVVALRYFNIYGPRQALSNPYTGVCAIFAARLLNGNAPLIFEDGLQTRDFVSVHDVVGANLLAMENSAADGMPLNIGSGHPIAIEKVAAALARGLDKEIPAEITGKSRAGDIRHCYADITAAKRTLGYEPRVSFSQGMEELAGWLASQHADDRAAEAVRQLRSFGLTA